MVNSLDNSKVFSFWAGPQLGLLELLSLNSFIRQGVGVELFMDDCNSDLPPGINVRPTKEILSPENQKSILSVNNRYSDLANYFRLVGIYETGMTWVDLDMFLLNARVLDFDFIYGFQEFGKINNAFLRMPPGHPCLRYMIDKIQEGQILRGPRGSSGPNLLTNAVTRFGMRSLALKPKQLYPIHFRKSDLFLRDGMSQKLEAKFKGAFAVHLWGEFSRHQINSSLPKHGASWIHKQVKDLLPSYEFGESDSESVSLPRSSRLDMKTITRKLPSKSLSLVKFMLHMDI